MNVTWNRGLAFLVLVSFGFSLVTLIVRHGIGGTPYDAVDSLGRPMGFNDPLNAEHYFIIVQNFKPTKLLQLENVYDTLLLFVHLVGMWLLIRAGESCSRFTRWFFVSQPLIFPIGFLALPQFPFLMLMPFVGWLDREAFIDIPFIAFIAHPFWIATSLTIAFFLRGKDLDLARRLRDVLNYYWKT